MIGAMILTRMARAGYETMNRKDLAAFMRNWAEDATFEFPGQSTVSGRYVGKQAISGFFRAVFDRMAVLRFTVMRVAVTRPYAFGLTNTVLVEWTEDATSHDGVTGHVEGVTIMRVRSGRIIAARDYFFDTRPLETMWGRAGARAAETALA